MPMEKKTVEPPAPKPAKEDDKAVEAAQKELDALYAKNNLPPDVDPNTYVAPSCYADKVDKATIVDAPPTE